MRAALWDLCLKLKTFEGELISPGRDLGVGGSHWAHLLCTNEEIKPSSPGQWARPMVPWHFLAEQEPAVRSSSWPQTLSVPAWELGCVGTVDQALCLPHILWGEWGGGPSFYSLHLSPLARLLLPTPAWSPLLTAQQCKVWTWDGRGALPTNTLCLLDSMVSPASSFLCSRNPLFLTPS